MDSVDFCPDGGIAALLIRLGAEVNLKAKDGNTALVVAAFRGNEYAVQTLVAAGADLMATTSEGETALMIARDRQVGRKESHDRIYQYLLTVSSLDKSRHPAGGAS
jgi:hypothetical protein